MDGFFGYNQIQIWKEDRHKTTFTTPWGTFAYRFIPFGLKNDGATFQRAMTCCFHDLIHIMLVYLDNLIARSQKQAQHIDDFPQVFSRCRKYKIRLNPLKCIFCVPAGHLLGFIVSHKGITVEPLKVQAILDLPSRKTRHQLQSFQGKANFLRHFVLEYATKAYRFISPALHKNPLCLGSASIRII